MKGERVKVDRKKDEVRQKYLAELKAMDEAYDKEMAAIFEDFKKEGTPGNLAQASIVFLRRREDTSAVHKKAVQELVKRFDDEMASLEKKE